MRLPELLLTRAARQPVATGTAIAHIDTAATITARLVRGGKRQVRRIYFTKILHLLLDLLIVAASIAM